MYDNLLHDYLKKDTKSIPTQTQTRSSKTMGTDNIDGDNSDMSQYRELPRRPWKEQLDHPLGDR
jgi:hypothetical protein